jgi:ankyrin repeat domain-containing protein 50
MSNSTEVLQMLIDRGADVNSPFDGVSYYGPVLVSAARNGDLAITQILLEAGAYVNDLSKGSTTALQAAAACGNVDVAQTLIDAGADTDAPGGRTFADARQATDIRRGFMRLTTPTQRASVANKVELVQILLHEGADVSGCPWEEYKDDVSAKGDKFYSILYATTALQAAVTNENAVLVRILLGAGADVDAQGGRDTPLQMAAAKNDAKIVQILLRHGADVNAPAHARHGRTALQAAASTGNCDWCKGCWMLVQMSMLLPVPLEA